MQPILLKAEIKMIQIISTTKDFNFQKISNLYYQTWQYAYVGIVPQALLDNLRVDIWHPETRWNNTLVALDGDKVVGFVHLVRLDVKSIKDLGRSIRFTSCQNISIKASVKNYSQLP